MTTDAGERYTPRGLFNELDASHTTDYIFAKQSVRGKLVLDACCGYGYGCEFLAKGGAKDVVGIDLSHEAIKFSKNHYNVRNLDFIVMNVQNLSFKDSSFDIVVSFEAIEHLSNTNRYLFEMHRVLKKDGVCIISTPNKKVSSPGLRKPTLLFHAHEFYPDELYILLSQYFKNVEMLGKKISNENKLWKELEYRASLKFKIILRLSQYEPIRVLATLLPLSIKQIFTGGGKTDLKPDDFEISAKDVESGFSLVAICRKQMDLCGVKQLAI